MQELNVGDYISILTQDSQEHTGIIMPCHDESILMLKLKSGYNIGIKKNNIKDIEVLKNTQKKTEPIAREKLIPDRDKMTISILHTGGTIASKVDYKTGGVVSKFTAEEILNMFPELKDVANIKSRLISNMASDDMRFQHYNVMVQAIEQEIEGGCDGIILTQGTDTLHYTAAALSFMLENLNIPVLVVGSQRSSDRGSSDAAMNLVSAAHFIHNSDFAGVAVCMHEGNNDDACTIIQSVNARKMHTSRRDAFKSVNKPAIASITYPQGNITYLGDVYYKRSKETKPLTVRTFNEELKVGMLFVHPHMSVSEFSHYEGYDGLVILGTGLGHCPISAIDGHTKEHEIIRTTLRTLAMKIPIVITSQTIFGRVDMNVYAPGRELNAMGVLGNYCDMTPECAFIKLAYLLSNYEKEEVKALFNQNLRGEISERSDTQRSYL